MWVPAQAITWPDTPFPESVREKSSALINSRDASHSTGIAFADYSI